MDWNSVVESVPQLKRGHVWCHECGAVLRVNAVHCLSYGWPCCCGYTMSLDSPAERRTPKQASKG